MLNSNAVTVGSVSRVAGLSIGSAGQYAYIYNESGDNLNFRFKDSSGNVGYSSMAWICESINTHTAYINSFQNGVNTLYNKCVSCGSTPSAKTPAAISTAIQNIYTGRYKIKIYSANHSITTERHDKQFISGTIDCSGTFSSISYVSWYEFNPNNSTGNLNWMIFPANMNASTGARLNEMWLKISGTSFSYKFPSSTNYMNITATIKFLVVGL